MENLKEEASAAGGISAVGSVPGTDVNAMNAEDKLVKREVAKMAKSGKGKKKVKGRRVLVPVNKGENIDIENKPGLYPVPGDELVEAEVKDGSYSHSFGIDSPAGDAVVDVKVKKLEPGETFEDEDEEEGEDDAEETDEESEDDDEVLEDEDKDLATNVSGRIADIKKSIADLEHILVSHHNRKKKKDA